LAVAAAVAVLAGASLYWVRATTPPAFARIQTLWGQVTLSGVAMRPGAAMAPGGALEIAGEGEAAFQVGRAADVRLTGPGRLAFGGTPQRPELHLDSGRLTVLIEHRRSDESFAVATTDGRVEVRGTRFVVGYTAAGSYVHVEEGQVAAFRQGIAAPFAVKAGETFALVAEPAAALPAEPVALPAPPSAPAPAGAAACAKQACDQATTRARKAMRAGEPTRAIGLVDEALTGATECAPAPRCLDELGYLRAEALRQAGRVEAAVAAYKTLNRTSATRATRQNALYAAAQLERGLGRATDARTSFERAYAVHPDGALAEEALAGLLELLDPASAQARATAESYLHRYPQGMAAAHARRILSGAARAP
jgi:hypothetical protein